MISQEQIFKLLNAANSVEDFHNSLQEHQINIVPKQIVVNEGQGTKEAAYNTMIENAKNIEKKTLKTKRIVLITPAIAALIFMSIIGAAPFFTFVP
jgi:hypothetical protein